MYLKLIRESFPCGEIHRGKLYSVHFEPNEMGDYNEHLTLISEVYEIGDIPPALIFPIAIRQCNGHKRLVLGLARRQSVLHLINRDVRESFFGTLLFSLRSHVDIRIEVCEM